MVVVYSNGNKKTTQVGELGVRGTSKHPYEVKEGGVRAGVVRFLHPAVY